jgi:hypothetical protein
MSTKSASQKAFSVLALLAALAFAALPLQAQAPRRPAADRPSVAATGEAGIFARLWSLVARLSRPEMGLKEGTSIDPDGNHHTGATTATSAAGDEGTSIDPNGRR